MIPVMSRSLAHERLTLRRAVERAIMDRVALDTRSELRLTAESLPDAGGFFPAHDTSGRAYRIHISEIVRVAY